MLANQAFLLAALVSVPALMYLLYRSIVPYEPAMPDFRLAGALFYPTIIGFALGLAHVALDLQLLYGGFGTLAYLLLYPAIESYAVIVVFNRNFFFKQPAAPMYFAVGGAALAFGLAVVETFRGFLGSGSEITDLWVIAAMLALAAAFVLFHTSKGLLLGTYIVEGSRTRGIALSLALEVPFGVFLLTLRFSGGDYGGVLVLMFAYAAIVYYWVWHEFFPKRMPTEMRKAIERERKRVRRLKTAARNK